MIKVLGLLDCAKGRHRLKEFNQGRVNMFTNEIEVYYECELCRYHCYIIQVKVK